LIFHLAETSDSGKLKMPTFFLQELIPGLSASSPDGVTHGWPKINYESRCERPFQVSTFETLL